MRTVFADSFYYFALVNPSDPAHVRATLFTQSYTGRTATTGWVLTELADGWARPVARRAVFIQMLADLRASPDIWIVPTTDQLLQEGIDLYSRRPDKEWSLTDCISFVLMMREGITEALTGDHHFEQAGFTALLK
jgi:predicted nucleic acid-binding protein